MAREKRKKSQKKRGSKLRSARIIKRELQVLERELSNLVEIQWDYAKRMLKFGAATWLLGISIFVLSIIVYSGGGFITEVPPISVSLLISAAAVPLFMTAIIIHKFSKEIKRHERIRHGLLLEYERSLLREVGELVSH